MNCFSAATSTYLIGQHQARETSIWQSSFLLSSRSRSWSPGLTSTAFSCKHQTGLMQHTHTHTNLWMLALGKVFLKVSVFFICSERKNCVSFGSAEFYPEGYLAYSATGTVTVRQQTFTPLNLGWLDLSESCCWS